MATTQSRCLPTARIADCGGFTIAVKRSGPRAPRFERLKVPPSSLGLFQAAFQGAVDGVGAAAGQVGQAELLYVVEDGDEQAVLDGYHQADVCALGRDYRGVWGVYVALEGGVQGGVGEEGSGYGLEQEVVYGDFRGAVREVRIQFCALGLNCRPVDRLAAR